MQIDQELLAIAVEDDDGFTSTIVQKQVSSESDIPAESKDDSNKGQESQAERQEGKEEKERQGQKERESEKARARRGSSVQTTSPATRIRLSSCPRMRIR